MVIETEKEYDLILGIIEDMISRSTLEELESLEMLSKVIEKYESIHYPIAKPSKEDAQQFRNEQLGL